MQKTIDETARRRSIQLKYNADHEITPKQIQKAITSALPMGKEEEAASGAATIKSIKSAEKAKGIMDHKNIKGAEGSRQRVYIEPDSATRCV